MKKVTPFLMFQGGFAEDAIRHYTSIIEDSEIKSIIRYGADGPGEEGKISRAEFTLKGQEFICMDSYVKHGFTFTPSFSIYLTCDSEEEIDSIYDKMMEGGFTTELMPLNNYGFSKKYGWLNDQYGVSWQLNLPE